jgi:alpha-beta hydrolase superfamily lysophospholipase
MATGLAVLALACSAPRALPAADQGPAGRWVGHWEREGSRLSVEMAFSLSGGAYAGSFSSAQLRVAEIPLSNIRWAGRRLEWDVVGDATTSRFSGVVEGDTLRGSYQEGTATGTFALERTRAATGAAAGREITFNSGGVSLSGTVVVPEAEGPFPGVVFLHGSGAEGRWATRFLADAFARRGIAALSYDKRGVGKSKGDWRTADFAELVEDASSAVDALRAHPGVDPARVGLHGHSQGGTIAPWVAVQNGHVAFVIASAGGALPTAETERYSIGNSLGVSAMDAEERRAAERFVHAIVATAYEGAPRSELDAVWKAVRDRPWAFEPPPPSDPYWSFSRRIAGYDAASYWRQVGVPVLVVYGEADERVAPRPNAVRISEALLSGRGSRLEVMFFPAADHNYRLRADQPGFTWPRTVPGYPAELIGWTLEVTRPRRAE